MTNFTHSLAVVIGIDAYEHGVPPPTTAADDARWPGRNNSSVWPRMLTRLQARLLPAAGRLRKAPGSLRRSCAGRDRTAGGCPVRCSPRPALPAPLDDGVNMPGPVVQNARIDIGACRPDKCAQVSIHPDLPKQLRIEERSKERADQDRREVDDAFTAIIEPHI